MTLADYLEANGISVREMAAKLGVGRQSVYQYLWGQRFPRPAILRRIIEVTDGAVGPVDFLNQNQPD